MAKALIKLVYRQLIDHKSYGNFERSIFHATYNEFLVRSEAYSLNGKFKDFDELQANNNSSASLNYQLNLAVDHFIGRLSNKIPGLTDTLGNSLTFDTAELKLVASDVTDKCLHEVAIYYNTGLFTLHEVVGEYLLLSNGKKSTNSGKPIETFLLNMKSGLSIASYQELNDKAAELLSNVRRFYFPQSN